MTNRLTKRFADLKAAGRAGFIPYVMAGDPDLETTADLLARLPEAGADVIELGFPFTDPMADGPVIQAASERALENGTRLSDALALVRRFRERDADTPVILMGYANPPYIRGFETFAAEMAEAGADGAIIVDLPPEEDQDLRAAFEAHDLALIRLATPTTDDARLPRVVKGTKGFVYYVSVAGVTGAGAGASGDIESAVTRLRHAAKLPVAVGFGVKTPEQAAGIARNADAVVVGSAIVDRLNREGAESALELARDLSHAVRSARS